MSPEIYMGLAPGLKLSFFRKKKKKKNVSMLVKSVKRHQFFVTQFFMVHLGFLIFCYNFLVIFDTPIFCHFPFKIK